jgi:uncharacterized membrane protein
MSLRCSSIIFFISLTFFSLVHAQERIIDFTSDITIAPDASMRVHEKITVSLDHGKRGLFRDFPTEYHNRHRIRTVVDFTVQKVTQNGAPVPYEILQMDNGKRIRIGDAHKRLPGGVYTYDIYYTTNRQLGFFDSHDELYWNVTGNGWSIPIERASVRIHLPPGIDERTLSAEAYTGYRSAKEQAYHARIEGESLVIAHTTARLLPGQGFTVVITWPKGHVNPPSWFTRLYYLFKDNFGLLWLLLGMIFFIIYWLWSWIRFHKEQVSGTIIPLFYPPHGLGPAHVRYLINFGYDNKAFAAEIIEMAVHGLITIECKGNLLARVYTLTQNEDRAHEYTPYYKKLADSLFREGKQLVLVQGNSYLISQAIEFMKSHLSIGLDRFFNFYSSQLAVAMIIAALSCGGFLVFADPHHIQFVYGAGVFFALCLVIFYYTLRGYTPAGKKLHEEIEGFKLFLSVTESERMKLVGTPPTRTPELYEKYLPYAVALDVEQQWSDQFAPVFERLAQMGTPYVPMWYVGSFDHRHPSFFASRLGNSLTNSVATSSVIPASDDAPGSSSGSGGGGSSGGGGGGGGGGTW